MEEYKILDGKRTSMIGVSRKDMATGEILSFWLNTCIPMNFIFVFCKTLNIRGIRISRFNEVMYCCTSILAFRISRCFR